MKKETTNKETTTKFIPLLKRSMNRLNKTYKKVTWNELAQNLKISKSYMSQILTGKRKFPTEALDPLITILDLDDYSKYELLQAFLYDENARLLKMSKQLENHFKLNINEPQTTRAKPNTLDEVNVQSLDIFDRWYYSALLDLTDTKDFRLDFNWIGKRLQITSTLAELSWNFLTTKGYLALGKNDQWEKTNKKFRVVIGEKNKNQEMQIVRTRYNYYSQFMELAKKQILSGSSTKQNRFIQGVTCSVNSKKFRKAKLSLEKNLYSTAEMLTEGETDEVYFLMSIAIPLVSPT